MALDDLAICQKVAHTQVSFFTYFVRVIELLAEMHDRYDVHATTFKDHISSIKPQKSCPPLVMLPALSPEVAGTTPDSPGDAELDTPGSSYYSFIATSHSRESPSVHCDEEVAFERINSGYGAGGTGEDDGEDDDEEDNEDSDDDEMFFSGYSPDTMRTMESRFMSLFSHDPKDVPELLDRFQTLLVSELEKKTATNSTSETPSSEAGAFDQGSSGSWSMTTTTSNLLSTGSPNLKRGRKKDDDDQKQRRTRQKHISDQEVLHFACPFRKRDPEKYGRVTDEKFSSCLAPRIPTLRRIT